MVLYSKLSSEQLHAKFEEIKQLYDEFKDKGLDLNMARGKPSPAQLDMSMDIFDSVTLSTVTVLKTAQTAVTTAT